MTNPLTPRIPKRPLLWPELARQLPALVADATAPVYIVGGAVRDAYRHFPIHDLDLTTGQNATALGRQIANRIGGRFFILDDERDVARVLLDDPNSPGGKRVIDVARFRGDDLLADLTDRDFTINALAVDLRGNLDLLIDPLNGEADLIHRILRQCNPQSIAHDPIRALRAVRQSVQLSARIEPETLASIRAEASKLALISAERIRDELFKLLDGARPVAALRVAGWLGLLQQILPELGGAIDTDEVDETGEASITGEAEGTTCRVPTMVDNVWDQALLRVEKLRGLIAALDPTHSDEAMAAFGYGMFAIGSGHLRPELREHLNTVWPEGRSHRALLTLAALLHTCVAPTVVEQRAETLRLSSDERKRLSAAVAFCTMPTTIPLTDLDLHRFWRNLGAAGVDVCLLALADDLATRGAELNAEEWVGMVERVRQLLDAYYRRYEQVVAPPPLVDGTVLMKALGLSPGPRIGELLTRIREGQVIGEITTIEQALASARAHLAD